jgi:hypothetical protein
MSSGIGRGFALLVLLKSAAYVGGHSGVEGSVAAFENIKGPGGFPGRVL